MLVINAFTHDTRVQKEAKSLAGAGHEITVFAFHGTGLPEHDARDGYRIERIRICSRGWGTHLMMRLFKYLEFNLRAVYRFVRMRPAVIHAHDFNALIPSFVGAALVRARLVYDSHELWSERRAPLLKSDKLRRVLSSIEGFLARRADAVITVNTSIADYLTERYHLRAPIVLMHSQEYSSVEHNKVLRQDFNIPQDRPIVIYAGNLAPGRGLENLVEATAHLDRAVVILMGTDKMEGQLQRLVTSRGLQERVFFREPVPPEDVLRYVASSDLGVIPTQSIDLSYHYSLENKFFHCLMAGIPMAVSNQPEKRRLVESYGVGAVFDETDPLDIARVINQLLSDEENYHEMCNRARRAARDVFNWGIESCKLLALYNQLFDEQ